MKLSINESIGVLTLDKVIDRNPVTVKPDTPLMCAIALMSEIANKNILLPNKNDSSICFEDEGNKNSSYVLVIEEGKIIGIFTETDVIKLIASETDLSNKTIADVMSNNPISLQQYQERNVSIAVAIMREHNIRHLPVVSSSGQLIGIITHENIRSALTPSCLLKMCCVSDVMNKEVVKSAKNASLLDIAKLISDRRVSCVVIVEETTTATSDLALTIPVGIVTERDLVKFRILKLDFAKTKVSKVMSQPLFLVNPCDFLWQTHLFMSSQQVKHLVVVEKSGKLVGILTQKSILQVFDPLKMSRVITVLQHQVEKRTQELEQQKQHHSLLQLEEQECFEAIAGSIAKDFDRLIVPILETARILALKFPDADRQTKQLLQLIVANSQRGIDLVEQILSFSSKLEKGFIPLKIDRVLSEVMLATRATFPKSIKIFLDLPEEETIPKVLGNAIQLHQIFMNLCLNSRNAMADGGVLRICLDKELIEEKSEVTYGKYREAVGTSNLARAKLEPYLVISFWDRGIGMSIDVKKQIFEIVSNPKKTNSAKRSGLFTVINTVKNHGGFVNINSEVGKGTLFKVYLPALETKPIQLASQLN